MICSIHGYQVYSINKLHVGNWVDGSICTTVPGMCWRRRLSCTRVIESFSTTFGTARTRPHTHTLASPRHQPPLLQHTTLTRIRGTQRSRTCFFAVTRAVLSSSVLEHVLADLEEDWIASQAVPLRPRLALYITSQLSAQEYCQLKREVNALRSTAWTILADRTKAARGVPLPAGSSCMWYHVRPQIIQSAKFVSNT
jgi:hypothetical protein